MGLGTLTLTSANTYNGITTISAGSLALSGEGRIPGNIVINSPASEAFNISGALPAGVTIPTVSISGSGSIYLGANTLGTQSGNYGGDISGTGGLTQQGSGTLILTGASSYTGEKHKSLPAQSKPNATNTIQHSEKVSIGGSGKLQLTTFNNIIHQLSGPAGARIVLGQSPNTPTLTVEQATADSFSGVISGTGNLELELTGTLTLGGANTFTGTTTVDFGTLIAGTANTIEDSSELDLSSNTSVFEITGFNNIVNNLTGVAGSKIEIDNVTADNQPNGYSNDNL